MTDKKFLRRADVLNLTGLKKSTIHLWAKQGRFPLPIKIAGSRASAWLSSEVLAWIEARTQEGIAMRGSVGDKRSAAAA